MEPNLTPLPSSKPSSLIQHGLLTVAACALTTLLATPLLDYLDLANIVMLFLLTVLIIAVKLGRNAAILASVLSVLLFDVFFVPPRFSLAVNNIQYLVTFAVMLVTALTTTHFTSILRQKALEAERREQRTQALYQLARQLAGALTPAHAMEMSESFIRTQLDASAMILLLGAGPEALDFSRVEAGNREGHLPMQAIDRQMALIALHSEHPLQNEDDRQAGAASVYVPLRTAMRPRGVLAVGFDDTGEAASNDTLALLEAVATLVAVALERLHYVAVAQATEVKMLTERLRSSILSALSHDLRTPLTAMVGLADSLSLVKPPLPGPALETAQALHEQAQRLAGLVGNLLDMARLNAGQVTLRREWQPLEEVVGASIKLLGQALDAHPVKVNLPDTLPLLSFDAILMERVFCNLLENAAKYAPAATPITVQARQEAQTVWVSLWDQGPGFPPGAPEQLFEMFVRGPSSKPGSGLGLAICKAIVEVHGGRIEASNLPEGGACVRFSLPVGTPPAIEEEAP